jgi:hypothetical protein
MDKPKLLAQQMIKVKLGQFNTFLMDYEYQCFDWSSNGLEDYF